MQQFAANTHVEYIHLNRFVLVFFYLIIEKISISHMIARTGTSADVLGDFRVQTGPRVRVASAGHLGLLASRPLHWSPRACHLHRQLLAPAGGPRRCRLRLPGWRDTARATTTTAARTTTATPMIRRERITTHSHRVFLFLLVFKDKKNQWSNNKKIKQIVVPPYTYLFSVLQWNIENRTKFMLKISKCK